MLGTILTTQYNTHSTIQYSTHNTIQYNTIHTLQYDTHNTIHTIQYNTHNIIQYTQCNKITHNTLQYNTSSYTPTSIDFHTGIDTGFIGVDVVTVFCIDIVLVMTLIGIGI